MSRLCEPSVVRKYRLWPEEFLVSATQPNSSSPPRTARAAAVSSPVSTLIPESDLMANLLSPSAFSTANLEPGLSPGSPTPCNGAPSSASPTSGSTEAPSPPKAGGRRPAVVTGVTIAGSSNLLIAAVAVSLALSTSFLIWASSNLTGPASNFVIWGSRLRISALRANAPITRASGHARNSMSFVMKVRQSIGVACHTLLQLC